MENIFVRRLFVGIAVGAASLFLLACSSPVPAGTGLPGGLIANDSAGPGPQAVAHLAPSEGVATHSQGDQAIGSGLGSADAGDYARFSLASLPGDRAEGGFGWRYPAQDTKATGSGNSGIVVSGSGRATSSPDLATLNLGVEATDTTVSEARTSAATSLTAIIAAIKEDGVEETDIQTGRYSIQPRYTGREVTRCIEAESSNTENGQEGTTTEPVEQECFQEYQSVITGYQVSNTISVKVRDLDTVDDVIDGAVEAGGDSIRFNGLSFSLEDTSELESQARTAAVADLKAKASELATLSGVLLEDLVYLTEVGSTPPELYRPEFALAKAAADSFAGAVSTPIAPGEVSVDVRVLGHFAIGYPAEDETTEDNGQSP